MYLVTAYFDEKSRKIIQRYMEEIASVTGNHFMTDNYVPPHLTISSVESREGKCLSDAIEGISDGLFCGSITIAAVGALFPYVLYAAPVLNAYLQEVSQCVYEAIKPLEQYMEKKNAPYGDGPVDNQVTIHRHYIPGQWLPHVTLGKQLSKDQMQAAFQVMQKHFSPFEATITRLGLARTNPHRDIQVWEL